MKLRTPLSPSIQLQLKFIAGMLVTTPLWLLLYSLPMFRDWPLWVLIGVPACANAMGLVWFRQCMSLDKSSFKPKWW
jgi:hypothetical protein